ncbi:MAG TPA: phage integrase SAM-like domain-containing protein, partial [Sedimentisphaerales bacterium]|nr:phage integrase SAM-like domain-containing protein [Sedimentisphaerales bacterium]
MASIIRQKTDNGIRYFIQLSPGENKARPKIALGSVNKRQAETAKINIQELVKSKNTGATIPPAVQEWLAGITDGLRKRLETLNIIEHKNSGNGFTVAAWVERYIKSRPDVKEATRRKWHDVEIKLATFFKTETMDEITVQHAKNFRVYLQTVVGLAENSIRRQTGIARQFFNSAIDAGLITKNPFRGQSVSLRANKARFYYIQPETAYSVLEACPDAQWRLIFGLARWGGLRCPSEVLRLQWQDIDFEHERFTVHASKTEHH